MSKYTYSPTQISCASRLREMELLASNQQTGKAVRHFVNRQREDHNLLFPQTHENEAGSKRGRLKIFFGASAGVGKTYAMLQAAHAQRDAGVDVLVGVVETHGRAEIETLALGLNILSRKDVKRRDSQLAEFDLDMAIARRPQLILIDELAHTNTLGSRHPKRWQDVQELLNEGINVYTTVSVQHLESLNDLIEQITDVRIHETIPNAIFEEADEVELIDLSAEDLLQRLKEGKVHVTQQTKQAAPDFFRKGNLIALRELSLRLIAAHVDEDMRDYRRTKAIEDVWPVAERILVCVGSEPNADRLVRAGKRIADALHAEWIVISVETPAMLRQSEVDRDRRIRVLQLAEELGAETVTLGGATVASEVLGYARARNVSRIVVGKPRPRRWLRALHPTPVDAIVAASGDIDVHVISGDENASDLRHNPMLARTRAYFSLPEKSNKDIAQQRKGYVWSGTIIAICTWLASLVHPYFTPPNVVMIYLLGVVVAAARFGRGPGILASLLSVITFAFLFVAPAYTFDTSDTEYLFTFAAMLVTSLVISSLTSSVRLQARVAGYRERRAALLYAMSRELAIARHQTAMLKIAVKHVSEVFDSQAVILLPDSRGRLMLPTSESIGGSYHGADLRVAEWVYAHRVPAGLGTTTLSNSEALYLPLLASSGPVGALAVLPVDTRRILLPEQRHLLETFAGQIALAIERVHLAANAQSTRLKIETERSRNSLLSAISHNLRTPLSNISTSANSLIENAERLTSSARRELNQTILDETQRMNTSLNNFLVITRLESGALKPKKQRRQLEEVVTIALDHLRPELKRALKISLPANLPALDVDSALIEQVIVNLLDNIWKGPLAEAPTEISAKATEKAVTISVVKDCKKRPVEEREHAFASLYNDDRSASGEDGNNLAFAICKAIIEAHGGQISAERHKEYDAIFLITLPRTNAPPT